MTTTSVVLTSSVVLQATIVGLFWSMASVLEKYYLLDKFTPYELLLLRSIVFFIAGLSLVCIYEPSKLGNIKKNGRYLIWVFLICIVGIVGTLMFWKAINNNNVGTVSSIVGSLRITFAVLIGYLFFKEALSKKQLLGVVLAIFSVFLISYK